MMVRAGLAAVPYLVRQQNGGQAAGAGAGLQPGADPGERRGDAAGHPADRPPRTPSGAALARVLRSSTPPPRRPRCAPIWNTRSPRATTRRSVPPSGCATYAEAVGGWRRPSPSLTRPATPGRPARDPGASWPARSAAQDAERMGRAGQVVAEIRTAPRPDETLPDNLARRGRDPWNVREALLGTWADATARLGRTAGARPERRGHRQHARPPRPPPRSRNKVQRL